MSCHPAGDELASWVGVGERNGKIPGLSFHNILVV